MATGILDCIASTKARLSTLFYDIKLGNEFVLVQHLQHTKKFEVPNKKHQRTLHLITLTVSFWLESSSHWDAGSWSSLQLEAGKGWSFLYDLDVLYVLLDGCTHLHSLGSHTAPPNPHLGSLPGESKATVFQLIIGPNLKKFARRNSCWKTEVQNERENMHNTSGIELKHELLCHLTYPW